VSSSKPGNKPYTGILAEPMPKYTALTTPSDQEVNALIEAKMKALLTHYGIEAADAYEVGPKMVSAWANLAWCLAREHVPGFRAPPRGRGAPAKRKGDDVTLVLHVELLRRREGLKDRPAIKRIAAQKLVEGTEETLRKRYNNVKKHFAPMTTMFDNMAAAKGNDALVCILEESLFGDEKDIFLSPL
jgi:hypothetical protein